METISAAIDQYHELLAPHAQEEWGLLQQLFRDNHLYFHDRFVCSVMRPVFMTPTQFGTIRAAAEAFLEAMRLLHDDLMEDASLRTRIGLTPEEWALVRLDPGYTAPDGFTRLDGFLSPAGDLHFIEFNAESPGGLAFADALSDSFAQLSTFQQFQTHYRVGRFQTRRTLLDTLLSHYREWGGHTIPTIAIVDWASGVGTAPEFLLCQERFLRAGVSTVITTPEALELRGNKLWDSASGQRIDLIYKRVVTGELLEQIGPDNILSQAVKSQAACMVNSFRGQMLFKKALFALLSEGQDDPRLSLSSRQALRRHLPWTRIVADDHASGPEGETIELVNFILRQRENLVLKPNGEYGGKGVVLGWEADEASWEAALNEALSAPQPYVVQKRIAVSTEPFPFIGPDGGLHIEPRLMDVDPYCHQGKFVDGAGIRLGTTGILNVTAGGGSAIPLFLIEPLG